MEIILRALETIPMPRKKKKSGTTGLWRPTIQLMPNIKKTEPNFSIGSQQINDQIKDQAKQNFTDTDYASKLYNQTHQNEQISVLKEPKFSDFYQPSEQQKQGELLFIGTGVLALGYAAFRIS